MLSLQRRNGCALAKIGLGRRQISRCIQRHSSLLPNLWRCLVHWTSELLAGQVGRVGRLDRDLAGLVAKRHLAVAVVLLERGWLGDYPQPAISLSARPGRIAALCTSVQRPMGRQQLWSKQNWSPALARARAAAASVRRNISVSAPTA